MKEFSNLLGNPSQPAQDKPLPAHTSHASTEAEAFNATATTGLILWGVGFWSSKYIDKSNTLPEFKAANEAQSDLRVGEGIEISPWVP